MVDVRYVCVLDAGRQNSDSAIINNYVSNKINQLNALEAAGGAIYFILVVHFITHCFNHFYTLKCLMLFGSCMLAKE